METQKRPATRTITVHVETEKVGSRCETEIEVDADATDEEIREDAKDAMFGMIEWGWK